MPKIEEALTQVANTTKVIRATATNYSLEQSSGVGYAAPLNMKIKLEN